jgi:hypothetical protein
MLTDPRLVTSTEGASSRLFKVKRPSRAVSSMAHPFGKYSLRDTISHESGLHNTFEFAPLPASPDLPAIRVNVEPQY